MENDEAGLIDKPYAGTFNGENMAYTIVDVSRENMILKAVPSVHRTKPHRRTMLYLCKMSAVLCTMARDKKSTNYSADMDMMGPENAPARLWARKNDMVNCVLQGAVPSDSLEVQGHEILSSLPDKVVK